MDGFEQANLEGTIYTSIFLAVVIILLEVCRRKYKSKIIRYPVTGIEALTILFTATIIVFYPFAKDEMVAKQKQRTVYEINAYLGANDIKSAYETANRWKGQGSKEVDELFDTIVPKYNVYLGEKEEQRKQEEALAEQERMREQEFKDAKRALGLAKVYFAALLEENTIVYDSFKKLGSVSAYTKDEQHIFVGMDYVAKNAFGASLKQRAGAIYKKDGKTFVRLTTEEETEGFLRNIKNLLGESL